MWRNLHAHVRQPEVCGAYNHPATYRASTLVKKAPHNGSWLDTCKQACGYWLLHYHFWHISLVYLSPPNIINGHYFGLTLGNWEHHWAAVIGSSHILICYRTIKLSSNLGFSKSQFQCYRNVNDFSWRLPIAIVKTAYCHCKPCRRTVLLKFLSLKELLAYSIR